MSTERDNNNQITTACAADVVVETEHTPGLTYHEWVYLPGYRDIPATVLRSDRGRKHKNASHRWLVMVCNEPKCEALAVVRGEALLAIVERYAPVPQGEDKT